MTSLNDIPLVGNVVNRIEDAAVDSAILRLRYLLCYKSLVKALKTEVANLAIKEDAISRKAVSERDDGKIIKEHVLKWQQDVENIRMIVEKLFERYEQRPSWMCFKDIPFAKPVSRFRLGKQAAEDAITVTQLIESGNEYLAHEIAHHPPNENVPISDTTYQIFESRRYAYGKLWEALVNEDRHPILGIYGMPGVGKTRLMEEAWKQAKEKGIFSKVARANVGAKKIDVLDLQAQLAGYLNCQFEPKDNEIDRASQLTQSLINGGKTLVIFDDVWNVIPLNKIGIPFGDSRSKGCKILFTSRGLDFCLSNNCEDPIEVKTLTEDEAWDMFKEAIDTSKIESFRDSSLANKVCKKCGRLPLLINAVGKAVKYMTENSWMDALQQLENCSYEEIPGVEPEVYRCLLLSFEKLTGAGKVCLLLCSLFPEDADINIKKLSYLATGSPLLNGPRNIAGVVDNLKSSSLLLQGEDDGTFKLHDIIRDVARSIAEKDLNYGFLSVDCRLGWPDNTNYHTRRLLHLHINEYNVCFPNGLVCPDLHTLWLQCKGSFISLRSHKLSSCFSEGLTGLRFLLQGMIFSKQKLSIQRLEKLMIIIIDGCNIDETFFTFVPQTLHTLCINHCSLPRPLDLSKLINLRKLKLVDRNKIKVVPQPISSLTRLEELNIPEGFTIWDDADADATSIYAELNKLTRLKILTIRLPYSNSCLDGDIIMSNLVEFNIAVDCDVSGESEKSIKLVGGNCLESGWMALVERADEVYLESVEGLSMHTEAFANLRRLEIGDCDDMDHLVRLPVEGRNQPMAYFSNLCVLSISYCGGLTYLFPASVANCLHKLQELEVENCHSIEEIVRVDNGEVIISFPTLKVLSLGNLESLKSFSIHNKVAFPSLEELSIWDLDEASEIWGKGIIYNQQDSPSFNQLKLLRVEGCDKLENVIPVSLDHEFNNLEQVKIKCCKSLKSVFHRSCIPRDILTETDDSCIVFSSLWKLELEKLPNINRLWSCDGETNTGQSPKVSFPNLTHFRWWFFKSAGLAEQIEVGGDDNSPSTLISLSLSYVSQEAQFVPPQWLLHVQEVELYNCMWRGHSLFNATTLTPNTLQSLTISCCKITGPLFNTSFFRTFQHLKTLKVHDCDLLEEIVEEEEEDTGIYEDEKTISLPSLTSLSFYNLPSLRSFSQSSTYTFNMPSLTQVYFRNCPLMDKFTSLPINTPLLQQYEEADLNRYVREKFHPNDV